ncbi:MAG: relaxase/mobilization nuclease domain-containing protein [Kocuria sp.]|nr:relaxase/mobilization nuclease domain-containing protein [Kocuria sp.]
MSVTNSKRIAKTRPKVEYELYGAKGTEKYRRNKTEGTDRVAALRVDAESPEEFVERAEALATAHGRRIEARSLIQSFESSEFDPNDPEAVQTVNDLGYGFAKKLHPNSDVLVITHVDGAGGHPHNHITVINHDNVTCRALQGNNMHWHVAKQNDELMRDYGLRVAERGSRNVDQRSLWEHRREGEAVSEFDRQLGDQIEESLADRRSVDLASYRRVLAEKGIELDEKVHTIKASADGSTQDHESVGWTYKALDTTGEKSRKRRRKASSLSEEFTHEGAQEIFKYNQERTVRHERLGQDRAAGVGGSATQAGPVDVRGTEDRVADQRPIEHESGLDGDAAKRRGTRDRRAASSEQAGSHEHDQHGSHQRAARAAARRRLIEAVREGDARLVGGEREAERGLSL